MLSRKGFQTALVAILIGFWKRLETDEEIHQKIVNTSSFRELFL
jgi:hypothetical protein